MKRALLDTNVILDIALKRQLFFMEAAALFDLIDQKKLAGYVTATTITDIYYISRKEKNNEAAIQFITELIEILEVVGIDKDVIKAALQRQMKDFEDAIQVSATEYNEIGIIITRNKQDFTGCNLQVFTPAEFIETVK